MKHTIWLVFFILGSAYSSVQADTPLNAESTNQVSQATTLSNAPPIKAVESKAKATPTPPTKKKTHVTLGDSKEDVIDLLGKPKGTMLAAKGWELLVYSAGEIELTNNEVTKIKFKSKKKLALKEKQRKQRNLKKQQAETERREQASKRKSSRLKNREEAKEKAEKEEEAWKEKMTERLGPKPSISSKKRKKLKKSQRWYWNSDGSINWDAVRENPPKALSP